MKTILIFILAYGIGNLFSQEITTFKQSSKVGIQNTPENSEIFQSENSSAIRNHSVTSFLGPVPSSGVFYYNATNFVTSPPNSLNVPSPCIDYQGLNGAESPLDNQIQDANGAVGLEHLVVVSNSGLKIQDLKTGSNLLTTDINTFFTVLNPMPGFFGVKIFDPKVLFDPFEKRWIIICTDAAEIAVGNRFMLAVSQTSNPLGVWNFFSIDTDPLDIVWFDYPSVGFNKNWIVVSANLFNGLTNTKVGIYAIDKNASYANTLNVTSFFLNTSSYGTTIHPCITYDNTLNTEWLGNNWNGNNLGNGSLRLYSLTGTPTSPVFNPLSVYPSVNKTWDDFSQLSISSFGCPSTYTIDSRVRALVMQGGSLWAVQKVDQPTINPTRTAVQWWEINPSTGNTLQFGRIDDPSGLNNFLNPSLAVNIYREVLIGYSHFSTNAYPKCSYSYRLDSDASNSLQGIYDYKNSLRSECAQYIRWGDYSSTFVEPNGINLWTIQEYPEDNLPISPKVNAVGSWWSEVCPTIKCVPNYNFIAPLFASNSKFEASNTITASSKINQTVGFIKFDAAVSITLNPGFETLLAGNNSFESYIDGCGGLRMAPSSDNDVEVFNETIGARMLINKNEGLNLSPVPVEDKLYFSLKDFNQNNFKITVIDALNNRIENIFVDVDNKYVNVSNIKQGIYFIEIETNGFIYNGKFIK